MVVGSEVDNIIIFFDLLSVHINDIRHHTCHKIDVLVPVFSQEI